MVLVCVVPTADFRKLKESRLEVYASQTTSYPASTTTVELQRAGFSWACTDFETECRDFTGCQDRDTI
ncbi:hypothetical protein F511_27866 [Dorcoceras hygrometricum]|uniref:Uncharacterized protein n=1 Tax=Dorcoceras hygrometricum TaxID=472368 RepID=A0A2Z7BMP4_9LAMI|nr:hypothetical protein F511_27866 [Dorcoceras hygrometricum]